MNKNKLVTWVIVIVTALAMVGFSGLFNLGNSSPQSQNQPKEESRAKVQCLTSEAFHIHPHLQILVAGKEEPIPANIGIIPGCTYELHTHAADGIVHIESAVDRGYIFADFMSVWKKPLLRDGYTLKMTVDGKETLDPNFVMKDGQQVVLEYTKN